MKTLTVDQYDLVYAMMSGASICLAGAFVYFILIRSTISSRYHPAMAVGAVVVGIAALHYLRIVSSWSDAFVLDGGVWRSSGRAFGNGLRYVDWLVTVPLLLSQLVLVLRLEREEATRLMRRLVIAATLMIALGYPGEVSSQTAVKLGFWLAGCVPFAYIVFLLWGELSRALFRYSDDVALAVSKARLLLVGSWSVYPVAFLFPIIGLNSPEGEVARQALYSVADVVAKVGFGLLIYRVARLLTEQDDRGASNKSVHQVDLSDAGRGLRD